MVNCISQPIKLDDLILITEPRSLAEMGDVSLLSFYSLPCSILIEHVLFPARSI